jgi:hypothetical protein
VQDVEDVDTAACSVPEASLENQKGHAHGLMWQESAPRRFIDEATEPAGRCQGPGARGGSS